MKLRTIDRFVKGIKFLFGNNITRFIAKEDEKNDIGTVLLTDGTVLPADIVIIGIGCTFYTNWIKNSSVQTLEDGSIMVDKVQRIHREVSIFRMVIVK